VGVTGRVLVNGVPIDGARLLFMPSQASLPDTVTDADGTFIATLAAPGRYSVRISADSLFLRGTTATFAMGQNAFYWNIEGGVLTVIVEGWERRKDASLRIESPDSSFQTRRWDARSAPVRTLHGVPSGTYTVSVESAGRRSQVVTVVVDRQLGKVEARLRFEPM
jgi:hypothetical protein